MSFWTGYGCDGVGFGNSITLKPLIGGTRTNLFVYSDYGRYNFSILTGSSQAVDYIVRIRPISSKNENKEVVAKVEEPFKTILIYQKQTLNGFVLKAISLKLNRDSDNPDHYSGRNFKRACERAGVRSLKFHDLRHTFASHFMMRGGNLFDLKELLGHSDIKTTMIYAHLSPNHLKEASRIVNFGEFYGQGGATGPYLALAVSGD